VVVAVVVAAATQAAGAGAEDIAGRNTIQST